MAQNMGKYELVFVVSSTLDEEAAKALSDKFVKLIEDSATLDKETDWGKKRFAYTINDLDEGYYTLVNFTAPSEFILELERVLKITDGILRFMTVREDE